MRTCFFFHGFLTDARQTPEDHPGEPAPRTYYLYQKDSTYTLFT